MSSRRRLSILFGGHLFLSSAWFLGNFWLIYLVSKGFSLTTAALMDVLFWGMILVSEIPTGYIADWLGRKVSVIISYVIQSFAIYLFAIAETLPIFLLSYGLWGFGVTFASGATEAWVYDEFMTLELEVDSYQAFYGRLLTVGFIASAIAGYLSGPIAEIRLDYTIYATLGVFILDVVWLFFIPETRIVDDEEGDKPSVRAAASSLVGKQITALGILQLCITGLLLSLIFWYQIYLDTQGVTYLSIAIILSTGGVILGLGSFNSEKITKNFGSNSLLVLTMVMIFSVVIMSISLPFAIAGYLVLHLVRGVWQPYFSKLLNSYIPAKNRATSLSILGALMTLTIVSLELISSSYIENHGFSDFYFFWSGLIVILIIPTTIYLRFIKI